MIRSWVDRTHDSPQQFTSAIQTAASEVPGPDDIARSGEHLCEFDQIAERVGEESELAADGRQDERLGHDHDAARSKRRDGCIHIGDVEAEMVVAAVCQTIAKI